MTTYTWIEAKILYLEDGFPWVGESTGLLPLWTRCLNKVGVPMSLRGYCTPN